MPARPTVVLDCRWLGIGGPGRTTELLLRGLAEDPPGGRWVLWGPEAAIGPLAWPAAHIVSLSADPRPLLGQRHAGAVPVGDLVVFMHQVRPLRHVPSVTMIYDTIALRHGAGPLVRQMKRLFLRRSAFTTRRILTISEHSKASIVRDLGVREDRIHILRFPFDDAFVARVKQLRRALPRVDAALFVGGFLAHKNLPRLLRAFEATGFRREGGRLVLAGGTPAQTKVVADRLTPEQRRFTEVRLVSGQRDLDELFATSLFLVQPSLEEGFGLPAWEAMCCGLPVCASDGGALPEVVRGVARPFPAASTSAMAVALDDCAANARALTADNARSQSERLRQEAPTVADFGRQFRLIVEREALACNDRVG